MKRILLVASLVVLALPGVLRGDDSHDVLVPTVVDLDWMVGRWVGEGLGGNIEEVFFEPMGGAMPCTFRLTSPDGASVGFYEFILIENTEDGVRMLLHHFSPGMRRWEDDPVVFDLVEVDDGSVLFAERDDEEERTRLLYVRDGDAMVAELIEERDGEDVVTATFRYTLADEPR